eukprot:scaffold62_cov256-Pinguiococcus_pyrenoidosus.AAC.30
MTQSARMHRYTLSIPYQELTATSEPGDSWAAIVTKWAVAAPSVGAEGYRTENVAGWVPAARVREDEIRFVGNLARLFQPCRGGGQHGDLPVEGDASLQFPRLAEPHAVRPAWSGRLVATDHVVLEDALECAPRRIFNRVRPGPLPLVGLPCSCGFCESS